MASTNSTERPMFPPGYIPDWPRLASWDSHFTAYTFMVLSVVTTLALIRNLVFFAKTKHTKSVYLYLLIWCLFRLAAFAMRGFALTDSNGQSYETYKSTQIVLSIGFMPLAEVLTFNVAEASTLIYELSHRTYIRLRILITICFVVFETAVTAFVIDYTLNKPFGSNVSDFTTDIVLREIGFNGLFLIVIYTFFASIRNCTRHHNQRTHPYKPCGEDEENDVDCLLPVIFDGHQDGVHYIPKLESGRVSRREVVHGFLDVYDDVELIVGEDGERNGAGRSSGDGKRS
ncbi:hypothetical protein BDR26DRAFT_925878 [Obelidium mucronatum]|nr:hypothetical protein BDR26DRAFT_925878 [Obelidium mucronatum]